MLNTSILFSSMYDLELLSMPLREVSLAYLIEKLYPKNTYYVFRRKKHDVHKYNSYLKTNNINTSEISMESLTYPAFPTYLLPPDSIIKQLQKSPKLSLDDGFRKSNWNDAIGEFYCCVDDIEFKNKKNMTKTMTYSEKLICHLNSNNNSKTIDNYIYSIYFIEKLDNLKYYCCFLEDITQKNDKTYSKKNDAYTQSIQYYTVELNKNNINDIMSNFGKS